MVAGKVASLFGVKVRVKPSELESETADAELQSLAGQLLRKRQMEQSAQGSSSPPPELSGAATSDRVAQLGAGVVGESPRLVESESPARAPPATSPAASSAPAPSAAAAGSDQGIPTRMSMEANVPVGNAPGSSPHAQTPQSNDANQGKPADTSTDAHKLIFFENLFFELDVDGSGTISFEEMRRVLAFTALSLTTEQREQALKDADFDQSTERALDRFEFMDLCVNLLWGTELAHLEAAAVSCASRPALASTIHMAHHSSPS